MRQAFGNELPISEDGYDPTLQSETATEDSDIQSESSSLGQSIVRAAKFIPRLKGYIIVYTVHYNFITGTLGE